jgi:hypothetical protein
MVAPVAKSLRSKTQAVGLDVGRWRRIDITPDDPVRVHALISERIG